MGKHSTPMEGRPMAKFYTGANVLKAKRKGRDVWQGVLKYQSPNPDYVPDPRDENQRRKSFGKKPNPDYVPDPREPKQRKSTITKQVRKVFDSSTVKTKSQATDALAEWRKQMEKERETPDAKLTVHKYVERYISMLEKLYEPEKTGTSEHTGISPTTAHDYRGTMRYFKRGKAIDAVTMRKLTMKRIQDWELSLIDSGLAGTTVAKAHRLLWSVCEHAAACGDLQKNPARGVKAPSRTSGKRPNALDAEGRAKVMQHLDATEPTQLTTAARLALYLGMRRGEVCGLTWGNVDLDGATWHDEKGNEVPEHGPKLRVIQSIGQSQGGTYTKPPKSTAGRRVLALKGGILTYLKDRRADMWAKWCAKLNAAGITPTDAAFNELYVCGHIDGSYYNPTVLTHEWSGFAKQFGIRGTEGRLVTFHGLRDSFATAAYSRNESLGTIANVLGHQDPALTARRYASGRDSAAQAAVNETVANDLDAARMGSVLPFHPRRTGTDN